MRPVRNIAISVSLLTIAGARIAAAQRADERPLTAAESRVIEDVEARFQHALAQRDRATLETLVAVPFTWIHASDGRVESRTVWLDAAAKGMALTGQRVTRTEHGVVLSAFGSPKAHMVIRISRVRLADSTRDSWLRQAQTFVRGADGAWRIAAGQGTLMYEGPSQNVTRYALYAGRYQLTDGRQLLMEVEDGSLFATLPNGARTQVFLGSATEEVVRMVGAGRLRFTLDVSGRAETAALVRGDTEVWRAKRAP